MKKRNLWIGFVAMVLAGGLIIEISLRQLHYDEFPVFEISGDVGYMLAPNQAGVFAGRHLWLGNKHEQQNESFFADMESSVLLLGESLTWGGVSAYDHSEKLGAALQTAWPERRIWSAGWGSWDLLNELACLKRFPELANGVHDIVFISNSADFATRSSALGELQHPSRRPLFVSIYLARKWGGTRWLRLGDENVVKTQPVMESTVATEWREWMAGPRKKPIRVTVFWYPTKRKLAAPQESAGLRGGMEKMVIEAGARCGCINADAGWVDASQYRDDIHPSAEGNRILARSIRALLERLWAMDAVRTVDSIYLFI